METPDAETVVVKSKYPYADAIISMAGRTDAFILAREHEESADAEKKVLGAGPYINTEVQPPVVTRFRKNPDYFEKPYPYFNEIELLGTADAAKKIADFSSRQVHMTWHHPEEERDQIKRARPDAKLWSYDTAGHQFYIRVDQAPYSDKRVRQALSMAIDRKAVREVQSKGEGQFDQVMSPAQKYWGFRPVDQLGAPSKYWNYDVQAAKQLLSAAGLSLPLEIPLTHWNSTVLGQALVDAATLTASQWRNNGVANAKQTEITFGQGTTTVNIGNYDGMYFFPNGVLNSPGMGIGLRAQFFAPPDGIKVPTTNTGHINDPKLSGLADKQINQLKYDERKQTFRAMEDILAEEQYRICHSTYFQNYFTDPSLRNNQVPKFAFVGSLSYIKYWWFA